MKNFERLNKNEMKMIVGGYDEELEPGGGDSGNCQEHKAVCTTAGKLNCCNGLICADYRCAKETL